MPKRSRDRRITSLDQIAARVNSLADRRACRKLIHFYFPGQPPSVTPGCAECAELQRQYEADPPPPAPPTRTPLAPGDDEDA